MNRWRQLLRCIATAGLLGLILATLAWVPTITQLARGPKCDWPLPIAEVPYWMYAHLPLTLVGNGWLSNSSEIGPTTSPCGLMRDHRPLWPRALKDLGICSLGGILYGLLGHIIGPLPADRKRFLLRLLVSASLAVLCVWLWWLGDLASWRGWTQWKGPLRALGDGLTWLPRRILAPVFYGEYRVYQTDNLHGVQAYAALLGLVSCALILAVWHSFAVVRRLLRKQRQREGLPR
jgi:hypothetical protein